MSIDDYNNTIELYSHDIYYYTDEYINNLDDPELIYKTMVFNGLLHFIYQNVFKVKPGQIRYNNKSSNIDYNNTYLINDIIDIYINICLKYNHIPSILGFSVMTGIDNGTINTWINEQYRNNTDIISIGVKGKALTHSETAKRLKAICEQALLANATENNSIGSIFALKANYNYNDQPKTVIAIENNTDDKSIDELALEYSHTEPPKQIDFNAYQDD